MLLQGFHFDQETGRYFKIQKSCEDSRAQDRPLQLDVSCEPKREGPRLAQTRSALYRAVRKKLVLPAKAHVLHVRAEQGTYHVLYAREVGPQDEVFDGCQAVGVIKYVDRQHKATEESYLDLTANPVSALQACFLPALQLYAVCADHQRLFFMRNSSVVKTVCLREQAIADWSLGEDLLVLKRNERDVVLLDYRAEKVACQLRSMFQVLLIAQAPGLIYYVDNRYSLFCHDASQGHLLFQTRVSNSFRHLSVHRKRLLFTCAGFVLEVDVAANKVYKHALAAGKHMSLFGDRLFASSRQIERHEGGVYSLREGDALYIFQDTA